MDGFTLCAQLRREHPDVPVIFLSARGMYAFVVSRRSPPGRRSSPVIMIYNRAWFARDLIGVTLGGGAMANPGRYLVLLPPINGATAVSGTPYFTEVNARFGGGAPLGIAAGVNAPLVLLARQAGVPITIPPLGAYENGLIMTRFDDSFFLLRDENGTLARRRI